MTTGKRCNVWGGKKRCKILPIRGLKCYKCCHGSEPLPLSRTPHTQTCKQEVMQNVYNNFPHYFRVNSLEPSKRKVKRSPPDGKLPCRKQLAWPSVLYNCCCLYCLLYFNLHVISKSHT